MEIFTWSLTVASIIGTVANIYKKQWCFFIWLATNTSWMIFDFYKGIYAQAFLFSVYTGLAVWGIIQWRAEK